MVDKQTMNSSLFPRGFSTTTHFPWPLVRAEELVTLKCGKALRERDRRPGVVRVYGTNGQCGWHDMQMREGPGVILGRKGQGPLGVEWCDDDYWVIDTAYFVTPKTDALDLKYFYYLVKYIGLNYLKDGTSNPSLSRDTFNSLLLPFPPISAQQRIVHILSTLDDNIELNQRMNETLEAMVQAVFKSWFVDFDPVHRNMDRKKRKEAKSRRLSVSSESCEYDHLFPDSFSDSGLGKIPNGWDVITIRHVIEGLFDGPHATPPKAEDGAVFLGIKNLTGTQIDLSEIRWIGESNWDEWTRRVTPQTGDIVFTYEATLGCFALIPPGLRCCLGRRLALVRPRQTCGFEHFLFHTFTSTPFQRLLVERSIHGSTVDRIPLLQFPEFQILWPSEKVRQQFEAIASPIWKRIHCNQDEARNLMGVRDTLLPKLLSGDLPVRKTKGATEAHA